jgi:UDP:flavonoid glycosyltransferase YjiC (YdhE family)
MKILVSANGSRGDVQPMLALAVALRQRGHEPVLAATPIFASEAKAFDLPFVPVGIDVQQLLKEHREAIGHQFSLQAVRLMNKIIGEELRLQLDALIPITQGFDRVVVGGANLAARTAAEAAGVPFRYIAYTPQILPSAYHGPIMLPLTGMPRWFNRLAWRGMRWFYNPLVLPILNERRRALGLAPVRDSVTHLFPVEHALVAADPEIFPLPPDLSVPQLGSFCLTDERPLPEELERFLAAGAPPVYLGFGSMPDHRPEQTTRLMAEAVKRAGCRAVISSGWAGLGAGGLGPDIHIVGPVSHWQLFPRLAAVVHHGGAGTTAATARAGVPHVVVPHAFDQFLLARHVAQAHLGVALPRGKLTVERLTKALERILRDTSMREAAARVGERIRQRNAWDAAVERITYDGGHVGDALPPLRQARLSG